MRDTVNVMSYKSFTTGVTHCGVFNNNNNTYLYSAFLVIQSAVWRLKPAEDTTILISTKFSSNSEADASELLENLEEMVFAVLYGQWCYHRVQIFNHTLMCNMSRKYTLFWNIKIVL